MSAQKACENPYKAVCLEENSWGVLGGGVRVLRGPVYDNEKPDHEEQNDALATISYSPPIHTSLCLANSVLCLATSSACRAISFLCLSISSSCCRCISSRCLLSSSSFQTGRREASETQSFCPLSAPTRQNWSYFYWFPGARIMNASLLS